MIHWGKCFLCGKWGWLEEHHIFGGALRKKSEKFGLKVGLCGEECHRTGKRAVHRCKETALRVKRHGQRQYMAATGATTEQFIKEFGKNYIWED